MSDESTQSVDTTQESVDTSADTSSEENGASISDAISEVSGNPEQAKSDAIDAAEDAGKITQEEARALKKKLKLKVDGKEFEEELDFNDDEALKRHLQKSKAFDSRIQEFHGFKGQVDNFFKKLQEDPMGTLASLGMDVDNLSTKQLERKIEEMKKSPEQLEREKMQKELEALRREKEDSVKKQQEAERIAAKQKMAVDLENDITSALDSSGSKLPKKNPKIHAMIAQNMLFAYENGYKNVTPKDVIPIVERQWKEELKSYFDTSAEDLIEEMVGKENLERLRKSRLSKNKQKAPAPTPVNQQFSNTGAKTTQNEDTKPKKKIGYREFFDN